jgi:hypothetical protein
VDLIVGVCYLTLLYAVVRFWETGAMFHLIIAGIASGFGLGVKYNMLVAVFAVQPIIVARLWRDRHLSAAIRNYSYYLIFSLPLCIFWYVRNFLKTGYPLYPYRLDLSGLHVVDWAISVNAPGNDSFTPPPNSALTDFLHDPVSFSLSYMFQDPGLGSFHGGLGAIFWGLGVPAMAYCLYKAVRAATRSDFFPALFWGQVPLTFFVYFLQISSSRLQFNQRLILVVVGFGLLALGIVLKKLRAEFPESITVIRSFCVAASALAVVHLAGYGWPSFQIKQPVADLISENRTSDYKYFAQSPWDLPLLASAWVPLDFLTHSGQGWTVYTAAPWGILWTAPVFGNRIQNKIWNFQRGPESYPDAFIFHRMDRTDLYYVRRKITSENVWSDRRFELVTGTPTTQLWARSKLLYEPETRKRLVAYYEKTFAPDIDKLKSIVGRLPDDGTLITSSHWGHGLKYLSLVGALQIPVHIVPEGKVIREARRLKAKKIITVGMPLRGFKSASIAQQETSDETIIFYENWTR